jgi:hypothetical protein
VKPRHARIDGRYVDGYFYYKLLKGEPAERPSRIAANHPA